MKRMCKETIDPNTGAIIHEHIYKDKNDHRFALINDSENVHPEIKNLSYVYTCFASPSRAQIYIKNNCKPILV